MPHVMSVEWARQSEYGVRFGWAVPAVEMMGGDVIVVVDILRFTTAVEAAVTRRAVVFPYRWRDESAAVFRPDLTDGPARPLETAASFRIGYGLDERSDSLDFNASGESIGDRVQVVLVGRKNRASKAMSDGHDVDVNDVARLRFPGQGADLVRFLGGEREEFAAPEESAQLSLAA